MEDRVFRPSRNYLKTKPEASSGHREEASASLLVLVSRVLGREAVWSVPFVVLCLVLQACGFGAWLLKIRRGPHTGRASARRQTSSRAHVAHSAPNGDFVLPALALTAWEGVALFWVRP